MLSDESSSDSETGRFKGRSKTHEDSSHQKSGSSRDVGRSRPSGNDRFNRNVDRRKEERDSKRHSRDRDRDRHRFSRHSPVNRRHPSRDRSDNRKSSERNKHSSRDSSDRSRFRDHRGSSKDRYKDSRSRYSSHDNRKDSKEDVWQHSHRDRPSLEERSSKKPVEVEKSSSPVHRAKRSEIYRPPPALVVENRVAERKKSNSPIVIDEHDQSEPEEVQLGSYYNMIPAAVKEKSDESSEIDSSDDERLRAKLLNLEKELHKTKKQKKHKKKHKRKGKLSKERELRDSSVTVEVSSTTDIDKVPEVAIVQPEVEEVTSTQKNVKKESCEEGEISSDDSQIDIDPTDLRHKLRRTGPKGEESSKSDVCGPALPPHLEKQYKRSVSPEIEGPALPPHLQRSKNIGPAIPDDMRKVLAEKKQEDVKYESSDEDSGIGPLPAGSEEKWSEAHRRLEERALDIKIKNLDGNSESEVKSREKWMLELPEGKAKIIGLEARSFRAKEGPDMSDRSSWTDTPEEKARKAAGEVKEEDIDKQLKDEARMRHIAVRDDEQETAVKKHKKKHKREESLLEIHQKKLKKKKKKEEKEDGGKKERRPFSRDVDLQVNRFDEAQKKSIIKKAQDLNTRFGRGEAKYL